MAGLWPTSWWSALKVAIERLFDRKAPQGAIEKGCYAQYATPQDLGRTAAEIVLALATFDRARAHEMGEHRKAERGSPFYGLPQVAELLGLK